MTANTKPEFLLTRQLTEAEKSAKLKAMIQYVYAKTQIEAFG